MMDKKPNKIHTNLIPTEIKNHTVQSLLLYHKLISKN